MTRTLGVPHRHAAGRGGHVRPTAALAVALLVTVLGACSGQAPARPGVADHLRAPGIERATSTVSDAEPAAVVQPVFALADYGGICDGQYDNRAALHSATTAAADAGGGTVLLPAGRCRVVATDTNRYSGLSSHVHLAGSGPDRTSLVLDTDEPAGYREMVRTEGSDVTVRDLALTAAPGVYGVLVNITGGAGVTLRNVALDGPGGAAEPVTLEGIMLPSDGSLENLRLEGIAVRNLNFGLLQPSGSTATVTGVTVERSTFTGNQGDDLAFNAPNATMTGITVQDNSFSGGGSFSISLANVHGAQITGNDIRGYAEEFVHIEDRSSDIQITGNNFSGNVRNDRDWYSFVFVISGSTAVQITGNTFRTSPAEHPFQCIFVGPGGDDYQPPRGITVQRNQALLATNTVLISVYGDAEVTVGS